MYDHPPYARIAIDNQHDVRDGSLNSFGNKRTSIDEKSLTDLTCNRIAQSKQALNQKRRIFTAKKALIKRFVEILAL